MHKKMRCLIFSFEMIICSMLLVMIIYCVSNILQRKDSDFKYSPFFEQKEDFDVLFFGTSHVIDGISPMELWNDYGIVSYNFGGHDNQIPTSYWVMRNALDYTTPKLVVIDILAVNANQKISNHSDLIHQSFDCFPLSYTKFRAVQDLCNDPNAVDTNGIRYYDNKWEYLWDFGKYHSRWNELTVDDFVKSNATLGQGGEFAISVATPDKYNIIPTDVKMEEDTIGKEYLCKMIQECQKKDIDVLLINIPYPSTETAQIAANSVYDVAEEYGVNYINFVQQDNVVDYNVDCYDSYSHLNPSGNRKVTDYLGKYITRNYDIQDKRKVEQCSEWNEKYDDYMQYKIELINKQDNLYNYLMLLSDHNLSSCIYINKKTNVLKDNQVVNLIRNITKYESPQKLDKIIASKQEYFLVVDNSEECIWECSGDDELDGINTTFGSLEYVMDNNHNKSIYIQDSIVTRMNDDIDMQMIVVNKYTGEVVDVSKWAYDRPSINRLK